MTPISLAILFALVGLALIVADVFLPSSGILTGAGVLSFVVCLIFCFIVSTRFGAALSALFIIAFPFAMMLGLRIYPHTSIGRRMTLGAVDTHTSSPSTVDTSLCVGDQGIALSALRPIGTCEFNGHRTEALSDRGHLPPNTPIVIASLQHNRPVVRPLDHS